jgi:hypothetical protein
MASEKPSIADAAAYGVIVQIRESKPDMLEGMESLNKWLTAFEALDEVKKYNA